MHFLKFPQFSRLAIAAQSYVSQRAETTEILLRHQTTLQDHRNFAQSIVRSPIYIAMVSLVPLIVLSGMTGLPFRQLSTITNTVIIGLAAMVLVASTYLWFGRWVYEGIKRNIPFVWVYCAFYTVAHVIYHLIFGYLVFDPDFSRSMERFFNTYPSTILLSAILAASFANDARKRLSRYPELVAVFSPVTYSVAVQIDAFGAAAGAKILYLRSQQKGTLMVTSEGATLLRRALSESIAALPLPDGIRCHRALWVAGDQVRDVVYLNGNPHVVVGAEDAIFPVSRASVAALRAFITQRKARASDL